MSEESKTPDLVELMRQALDAANQRDADAVLSFFAPGAIFAGRALGDIFEGRAAIRGFLEEWFAAFPEGRYEIEEFVSLDDGLVLAVVNQEGRPVGVDGQVHQRRDGRSAGRPTGSSCDWRSGATSMRPAMPSSTSPSRQSRRDGSR